jgi:hypothetical protein
MNFVKVTFVMGGYGADTKPANDFYLSSSQLPELGRVKHFLNAHAKVISTYKNSQKLA